MKSENTKERAFSSGPGGVRDLESFKEGIAWLEVMEGTLRISYKE